MASTATCAQFVCVVSRWCQGVGAMHLRWTGWPSDHRRKHRFSPPPWQQPFLSLPPYPKTKQLPFRKAHAASAASRGRLERPPQHLRRRRTRPGQRSCRRLGAAGVRLASERIGRQFSFGSLRAHSAPRAASRWLLQRRRRTAPLRTPPVLQEALRV